MQGTIKVWNFARGFGFAALDDSQGDVFVHASALEPGVREVGLEPGQRIELDVVQGVKGRRAERVSVLF